MYFLTYLWWYLPIQVVSLLCTQRFLEIDIIFSKYCSSPLLYWVDSQSFTAQYLKTHNTKQILLLLWKPTKSIVFMSFQIHWPGSSILISCVSWDSCFPENVPCTKFELRSHVGHSPPLLWVHKKVRTTRNPTLSHSHPVQYSCVGTEV